MNKIIKKVGVLLCVFIVAVAIYFVWAQGTTEKKTDAVYTSLEEATLPVVYMDMYGKYRNSLHGYLQDMGQAAVREALTILPQDRQLKIRVDHYEEQVTGISYEVRSLDLERLVERTSLDSWDSSSEGITAVLPIQNLLTKDLEYLLDMSIVTEQHGTIHYYTRIMWTENANVDQMITFAIDFSSKTFDYNQAKELVTYLETNNTEDNSSLGYVTIRSSFSQLTWGGLKVQPEGTVRATLKELDGTMANVQLDYLVSGETEDGKKEIYEVMESFTMKWNTQRIYLMDYVREMNQIFSGSKELFSGKRIMLGISNDDRVRLQKSDNNNYLAFVSNRDLWTFNQSSQLAVKVFSFQSGKDDGIRSDYNQHDVKILSINDAGDVDFLVYGYMNRGVHEGHMGVVLYRYTEAADAIEEKFFIPARLSFEVLREDIRQLSYLGSNEMLYILIDHAVYGIDLNSNEYMVVADALIKGSYAVSQDGMGFAWQEGSNLYGSKSIHMMNLDTGRKQEITNPDDDMLRILGYVGGDFIYGLANEGDEWEINGRVVELPMYALEIVDGDLNVETRYEKEGHFISSVKVQDSRIHLNRISKLSDRQYTVIDEDTLVCNDEMGVSELDGIGWYASPDRRKLYFVQMDWEIKYSQNTEVTTPKKISYETAGTLELKANTMLSDTIYYAYGSGHLQGITDNFTDAVNMSYGKMGIVTNQNQEVVWNRIDRSTSRNIKNPDVAAKKLIRRVENGLDTKNPDEGIIVLDARGCSLNQVLYYVDHGCPVVAYVENGQYYLISGYDQYNITLFNPDTGESVKMGLNDAANYFQNLKNDFICGLLTE